MRPLNRPIPPVWPVQAYRTFRIAAPLATHWRPATCAEAQCPHYLRGWKTVIDETTEQGQRQAYYIRRQSGRRCVEERTGLGATTFVFEPGQKCFGTEHRVPLEREAIYLTRDGDWRGNPTGRAYRHTRPEHWVEDSAEHQQRLIDQIRSG